MNDRTRSLLQSGSVIRFTRTDFEQVQTGVDYVVTRYDTKTVFKKGYDEKVEGYDLTLVTRADFEAGKVESTISVQFPKEDDKAFVLMGKVDLTKAPSPRGPSPF